MRAVSLFAAAAPLCAVPAAVAGITVYRDLPSFLGACGPLVREGFDQSPWVQGVNPQPLTNLGVTWTASEDLGTAIDGYSPPRSLGSFFPGAFPEELSALTAELPPGTTAAGSWLSASPNTMLVRLTAYDAAGAEIGSADIVPLQLTQWSFTGVTSDVPIARVVWLAPTDIYDDFLLDDVYVGGAVPAPACAVTLALAAFAARRRR